MSLGEGSLFFFLRYARGCEGLLPFFPNSHPVGRTFSFFSLRRKAAGLLYFPGLGHWDFLTKHVLPPAGSDLFSLPLYNGSLTRIKLNKSLPPRAERPPPFLSALLPFFFFRDARARPLIRRLTLSDPLYPIGAAPTSRVVHPSMRPRCFFFFLFSRRQGKRVSLVRFTGLASPFSH